MGNLITMYDSIPASGIPADAAACAGYCDGNFAYSWIGMVRRFPHLADQQRVVSIGSRTNTTARIIDVEPGNPATPGEAAQWIVRMINAGVWRPGFYTSRSAAGEIDAALARTGLHRNQYVRWIADWRGSPYIGADDDACQWTDHGPTGTDISVARESFFPPASKPKPKPHPRGNGVAVAEVHFDLRSLSLSIHPKPSLPGHPISWESGTPRTAVQEIELVLGGSKAGEWNHKSKPFA